jgi:hypothetical protein
MEAKFTFRDILVYFLTGLAFLVLLSPLHYNGWYKTEITQVCSQLGFGAGNFWTPALLALPAVYLLGHVVDCLDLVRLNLAKLIKPKPKGSLFWSKLLSLFYIFLVGDRVTGLLYSKPTRVENGEVDEDFDSLWDKGNYLQTKNQFAHSDYWYMIKDLFNSLQSACILCLFLTITSGKNDVTNWEKLSLFYFLLLVLFWVKSRYFAKYYIKNVINTFNWLRRETIPKT